MELENLRQQKPEGSDPFGGNRWFRIAIIVLGALSVVGVLVFLLIFLGFCAPNRQAANATPQPSPTAVIISEPQASPTAIAQQPTAAPSQPTAVMPTATLVISPPTTAPTKAAGSQATDAPATAATAIPITVAATTQPTVARATAANRIPTIAAKIKQGPFAGLSVIKLRYAPDNPVRNDPVYFYATISNRTGKDQNYRMCAEIYLPGKEKPLGTTDSPWRQELIDRRAAGSFNRQGEISQRQVRPVEHHLRRHLEMEMEYA